MRNCVLFLLFGCSNGLTPLKTNPIESDADADADADADVDADADTDTDVLLGDGLGHVGPAGDPNSALIQVVAASNQRLESVQITGTMLELYPTTYAEEAGFLFRDAYGTQATVYPFDSEDYVGSVSIFGDSLTWPQPVCEAKGSPLSSSTASMMAWVWISNGPTCSWRSAGCPMARRMAAKCSAPPQASRSTS